MCPEHLEEALDHLANPFAWTTDRKMQEPFAYPAEEGKALSAAYAAALPTLAFGYRLYVDPTITKWVDELQAIEPEIREHRAREMAAGAPRGIGRKVVLEMLMRGAETGRHAFVRAGTFAAVLGADPNPQDAKRAAKRGTEHNKLLGLATTADRIVRALVAYPTGIEPAENPEAARRTTQRFLQEVAVRVLGDSEERPASPAALRRLAA